MNHKNNGHSPASYRPESAWHVDTNLRRTYRIERVDGLAAGNVQALVQHLRSRQALLVTSPTVADLYGDLIVQALRDDDVDVAMLVLDLAEEDKSLEQVTRICQEALQRRMDRRSVFVGLGGGVCTDVVTVAASLYRRGVANVRIPTTLVGQIDASIGIKGAVNVGAKKNSLGCYYPPSAVLIDRNFLRSLSQRQISHGLAEIVKIAVVSDPALFDLIELHAKSLLATRFQEPPRAAAEIIERAITRMVQELAPNIYEDQSYQRLVDFGHTFSPLLEAASDFRLPHGDAVAIDMALSCELARQLSRIDRPTCRRVIQLLRDCGLPVMSGLLTIDLVRQSLIEAERHRGGEVNLVIPTQIGQGAFVVHRRELSESVLEQGLAHLSNQATTSIIAGNHRHAHLVFDIGGTSLRAGIYDPRSGSIIARRAVPTSTIETRGREEIGELCANLLDRLRDLSNELAEGRVVETVSVSFAGPLDARGHVTAAPTIWGPRMSEPLDLKSMLQSVWPHARVAMLNDVAAAGYRYLRHARDSLCVLTVGSGIGNKIFIDGKPFIGASGRGGEMGHWRVDFSPEAMRCDCGGQGHLGAVASGRGALATARHWIAIDHSGFAQSQLYRMTQGDAAALTTRHLVQAFHQHDAWACELIAYVADKLGHALAAVHTTLGIEHFVIFGGFALALGQDYRRQLVRACQRACWDSGQDWDQMIVLGADDDDSGLIGAGHYLAGMAKTQSYGEFNGHQATKAIKRIGAVAHNGALNAQ